MTETSTNELSDYAEYRNAIETMADAVEEKIEEYWEDYSGDVHEMVWEEVDSSQYIIYYGYNLDVLKHAENEPQEWKHRVAEDADYREVLQVMAYSAMERDLYDELQDRGVEV